MRLRLKKLEPDENDLELYFGVLFVPMSLLVAGMAMILPGRWVPPCTFHRITGLPCPTCGTYRCIEALLSARIIDAFLLQPVVLIMLTGAVIYFIYSATVVAFRLPRIRICDMTRPTRWLLTGLFALAVIANWIYLIANGR